eukprot:7591215-Pyramimonas_sp.AAC.1
MRPRRRSPGPGPAPIRPGRAVRRQGRTRPSTKRTRRSHVVRAPPGWQARARSEACSGLVQRSIPPPR